MNTTKAMRYTMYVAVLVALVALVLTLCFILVSRADADENWKPYKPTNIELRHMVQILPEVGARVQSGHTTLVAIRVGESYKPGTAAFFTVYSGQIVWGFEKWERLQNGKLQLTYWRFRYDHEKGYTLVTIGEMVQVEVGRRTFIDKAYEVPIDMGKDSKESRLASEMSQKAWQLLKRAGPQS